MALQVFLTLHHSDIDTPAILMRILVMWHWVIQITQGNLLISQSVEGYFDSSVLWISRNIVTVSGDSRVATLREGSLFCLPHYFSLYLKKIKIKKTQSHHHCLFAICMYPSLKCLFMTLIHFPIGLFICLFKVKIWVFFTYSKYKCFVRHVVCRLFSLSVVCLFIFFMGLLKNKCLKLVRSNL